ncbi:hypothetical protein EYF80_026511 [Liparis tanakae]|uniref:Uncharacterized protein n=1 Tax=Liparis tanakae TaxID=230148 RepID=A0A4Z2HCM5_9TELE|nr:hypothetical protein EYF80_026511 [Liparis tanakae]
MQTVAEIPERKEDMDNAKPPLWEMDRTPIPGPLTCVERASISTPIGPSTFFFRNLLCGVSAAMAQNKPMGSTPRYRGMLGRCGA